MSVFTDLLERGRALLFSPRQDREMDDEFRFHLDREIEERMRRGASHEQARRDALIAFGGADKYKEGVRDARGVRPLQDAVADIRFALRALRRNPIFTADAILVLALGIGASTAVFSVADAVLLAELPYPNPERLVRVVQRNTSGTGWQLSTVDVQALRAQQRSFSSIGFIALSEVAVRGDGGPQQALVGRATTDFFKVFGATPEYGRLVEDRDESLGAPPVVVITHAFAERSLGGAARAVGRTINVDGKAHQVIGVLPSSARYLGSVRAVAFAALQLQAPTRRGPFWMRGFGRLREGATIESASQDLAGVSRRLFPVWASSYRDSTTKFTPIPLRQAMLGPANKQVGLFAAGVGLVFLVAVANVAMLMLVRGSQRQQELAVRGALGAGTSRLARLLITESLVLTCIAGVVSRSIDIRRPTGTCRSRSSLTK